jgi:hypothetical protein
LAGFHSQTQAADVCLPEAAKSTAEVAAGLSAMVKLCKKASEADLTLSRKEIASNAAEAYPCAKDTFMVWYDARWNEAMGNWNVATKAQKEQVCAGLEQFKAMSEEMLKSLQSVRK